MSTIDSVIGEHDVVVLLNPVGRWPAGTEGTVISDHPDHKLVEMPGIEDSSDDEVFDFMPAVATEDLGLVSKSPHGPFRIDVD